MSFIMKNSSLAPVGKCFKLADVAQLVEQLICNQPVVRSNRSVGLFTRRDARVAKGIRL